MDWQSKFSLIVLALVAVRESLLLIAGMGAKRRADGTAGGQSLDSWKIEARKIIEEAMEEKLRPICTDLDDLLERRRRRR